MVQDISSRDIVSRLGHILKGLKTSVLPRDAVKVVFLDEQWDQVVIDEEHIHLLAMAKLSQFLGVEEDPCGIKIGCHYLLVFLVDPIKMRY